jgi:hypothetical protein
MPEELPWVEETREIPDGSPSVIWDHLHATIREGTPFPISLDEAVSVMELIDQARHGTQFELRGVEPEN